MLVPGPGTTPGTTRPSLLRLHLRVLARCARIIRRRASKGEVSAMPKMKKTGGVHKKDKRFDDRPGSSSAIGKQQKKLKKHQQETLGQRMHRKK